MNIYIVDYLGIHCGMHYYNDAFVKVLHDIPDAEIRVLSNYEETGKRTFFCNQYRGCIFRKLGCLIMNYLRLIRFVWLHRADCFIYLTYGNKIDLPFMWIVSLAPKHLIDIHEAIAQNIDGNKRIKQAFRNLYECRIRNVIVHSDRTDRFLDEYNFAGLRLKVPHFRYQFGKNCRTPEVGKDVLGAIIAEKINILFFGNINISKGIDILIDAVNKLNSDICQEINVVIAGKDFDHAIDRVKPRDSSLFHVILRHINDDELVFLYTKCSYVALPYRKTSQSGILEMAFYFRKPIIASHIPYFEQVLTKFPSFGVLADNESDAGNCFARTLSATIERHGITSFFDDDDWNNYVHREEMERFRTELSAWMHE